MVKRIKDTAGTQTDIAMQEANAATDEAIQPEPEDDLAEALLLAEALADHDPEPPAPVSASPARIPESIQERAIELDMPVERLAGALQQPDFLAAVKKAGDLYARRQKATAEAMAALQEAAKAARLEGEFSLRKVAAAAGVSYDTVDRWTK